MPYRLSAFDGAPLPFTVTADAVRQQHWLHLTFTLSDPDHLVIWPAQQMPSRQDYLWENTCFEAFIKAANQAGYVELNLAPSSAWNLYQFDNYRTPQQMPPRRVMASALESMTLTGHTLTVTLDLDQIHLADQEINIRLTAVITTQTALYYLALHHPATQADFHDVRGWTITLLPDARFPESVVDNKG